MPVTGSSTSACSTWVLEVEGPSPDRLARARCLVPLLGHMTVRLASLAPVLTLLREVSGIASATAEDASPQETGSDAEVGADLAAASLDPDASAEHRAAVGDSLQPEMRLAADEVITCVKATARFAAELAELCSAEGQWLAVLALAPQVVQKFGDDLGQLAGVLHALEVQLSSEAPDSGHSAEASGSSHDPSSPSRGPPRRRWPFTGDLFRRAAALRATLNLVEADLKADIEADEPFGGGRLRPELEASIELRPHLLRVTSCDEADGGPKDSPTPRSEAQLLETIASLPGGLGRSVATLTREFEAAKQYCRMLDGRADNSPPSGRPSGRGEPEPRLPPGGRDQLVSETQASGGSALHRWIRTQVTEPNSTGKVGSGARGSEGAVDSSQTSRGKPQFLNIADIPHEFLCPITQDVMRDAVSTADGHTYERRNIEAWLAENSTSPITGLSLANKSLIPNHNLRKLILDSGVLARLEPHSSPSASSSAQAEDFARFHGDICCEIVVPRDAATLAEAMQLGIQRAGAASTATDGTSSATVNGLAGRPPPPRGAVPLFGIRLLAGDHQVQQVIRLDQEVEIVGSGASVTVLRLSSDACLEFTSSARLSNISVRKDIVPLAGTSTTNGRMLAPLPRLGARVPALIEITQGSCMIEQCDLSNAAGSAIRVSGAHTTPTITHNNIHGCLDTGVVFKEGADGTLSGNRLFGNNSVAIEVHTRADPVIEDNDVFDGRQGGIFVYGWGKGHLRRNKIFRNALEGVEIKQGGRPLVEDNDIYDNLECGIFIHEGGEGRIISNRVHSNSYAGIEIKDTSSAEVRGNDVYSGRTSGMYVHSGGTGVIEDNWIHQNWLHGVYVRNKGCPHLLKNTIYRNDECGVFVTETSHPVIEHNEVHKNGLAGIEVKEGSNPTIKLNRIHEGNTGGIFVLCRGRGRIFENKLYKNKLEGIEIKDGGDPQVTDNEIYENLECGVFAHDGALGRIEGNRIFENAYAGVEIKDLSNTIVKGNRIYRGHTSGVYVHSGGRGKVTENDVFENGLHGVMILSGGHPTMTGNQVHDNAECGVVAHVAYSLDTVANQIYSNRVKNVQVVKS